ncbi:Dipeptidyl aminopeptidase/acylaminoacyl peptidase [Agrococcus baldri]|uniref:Dipeptidyl aminopeptidase/acylaminoacyl peptidase n=1 Tax=Agrococcus baldri TaxID=153730 RepID=A0AA94HPL6_9MICO|nr:prolyl oligopeptidase family serine peptidase [Agrococcus baldri]SFS18222.1 Dipeptidyl aminopeptidase/acylaminoacyl peptidase [Agrococcus baldri]
MRAEDIEQLVTLSRPAVHPGGKWAIVAASRPDLRANRNVGQLWKVSLRDGSRRRLTGGTADRAPQLTPDGQTVLFVRPDAADTPQVWAMRVDGGEPVQATAQAGGVLEFAVSPTGDRIAFTSIVAEPGRYGSVAGVSPAQESPRLITRNRNLANGLGSLVGRHAHLFTAALPDLDAEPRYDRAAHPHDDETTKDDAPHAPEAVKLSHGDFDHAAPAFSSDGERVLCTTARHDTRDDDLLTAVVEFDATVAEGEPHTILSSRAGLSVDEVQATPDGGFVLIAGKLGDSGRDFVARQAQLFVLEQPGAHAEEVTDEESVDLGESGSHSTVVEDGVLVQERRRGRVRLVHVTGGGSKELIGGDLEVLGHGVGEGVTVATVRTPTSMGELAVLDDRGLTVLTDFGKALGETGLVEPSEHEFAARDGGTVHGWVFMPEGEGPHPVLLNIHGGPFAQYGVGVFDEAQVAVAAGYAVVQCNPRGSAGYGRAHGAAIKQAMGTVDLHDVLDFLDGALDAHPSLDRERLGIMGGSYGGYLTAWTIANDHRFTAAVVERGFLDPESFVGTSDIGWFFSGEYTGTDADAVRAQSPMAQVGNVQTPTLVVHSEQDWRCPPEQAQRYWAALKRNGVETALLLFPGEDHELTRTGQPRHRVERFEHILAWWAKHLPTPLNHG